jgi:hypothetical protein
MGWLKKPGSYFLLALLLGIFVLIVMRLGTTVGSHFTPVTTPTLASVSGTDLAEPTQGDSSSPVDEQLAQIDQLLKQSIQSSIAYNVPDAVTLDKAVTIELLLNPSVSPTQLASQIDEGGEVRTAIIDVTSMMKVELIPQDEEALRIQPIHADAIQPISSVDSTRWAWLVTGKKGGVQKLVLVIYRLIILEGDEYWREVESYQTEINVEVTVAQQLQTGWMWAAGTLFALLLGAVLWRSYARSRKQPARIATSTRMVSGGHIFLSYRRADSADITGRIYDRLVDEFGRALIFKDVDSIPLGTDFKEYLDRKVGECRVLLAVIGDRWVDADDPDGKRRLDDPADFVRVEIESALARGIPVIPLLVRGAPMPVEEMLPVSLRGLVYRNGIQIRPDPDFHRDMDRLISSLNEFIGLQR